MPSPSDQFFSFIASERANHRRRLRVAAILCIIIAALLYSTEWIVLRPGLTILLIGQGGVACALLFRNHQLGETLGYQKGGAIEKHFFAPWFDGEISFVRRLSFFESLCQIVGFVVLGYEFWIASRSLWLALAIGAIYPSAMYFGISRKANRKAIRDLLSKGQEMATNFDQRISTAGDQLAK
jgi:hypothetical protein